MLILLRPILLTLLTLSPSLATAQEHPLAPFAQQLQSDVLFLTELQDLQERLIKTAEQDPGAVKAEGRRGGALCKSSPVETVCALLPYTVGEDDD
jgi:hypothetical protein